MTDTSFRYLKLCPRGFHNEITYYRVPADKVEEAEREYEHCTDENECGGYSEWTNDLKASVPGVAID